MLFSRGDLLIMPDQLPRILYILFLIVLTFSLRFDVVDDRSIAQDEATMMLFAEGVLERGYPFLRQTTGEFIISTYELLPYPIALSLYIFGESEAAVRLPAIIFACITACLIFLMGERFHCRRVAIVASFSFAILPWSIYWGSNAFYPSQLQCFSLMTILVLHGILVAEKPMASSYYLVALCILLTYFSWEGSGFLLPVFFITAMILTWGRWRWLKTIDAWVAAFIIIFGVVAQLGFRTILRAPFTGLGSSRQDVSFVNLAYETYSFNPTYYLTELAGAHHFLLVTLFVTGFILVRRYWNLAYLYLIVVLAMIFLSGFLGYYALRYVYFLLPAMLMIAAITGVVFIDKIVAIINASGFFVQLKSYTAPLVLVIAHLIVASPWGIQQITNLSNREAIPFELNYDSRGFSFRDLALELKKQYREGDKVVVQAPFPVSIYWGMSGDYFLQIGTATTIFYHPEGSPYYLDKWVQNPVLRSQRELEDLMYSAERVWFVFSPIGGSRSSIGNDLFEVIENNTRSVLDTPDGKLLLWNNPYASH